MTTRELDGQIALVTGAGKGIGRATALMLAKAGARVIAVARTSADLEALAAEARLGAIEPWAYDVGDAALYDRIRALPRLDILFNNAGVNKLQPLLEIDDATLDWMLAVNVRAAFKVAQAAADAMIRAGNGGSIVHTSSVTGHVGSKKRAAYTMTKHAIEGLTKAMAVELAEHGIRVNAVAPTVTRTALTEPFFKDPEYERTAMATIPLKRIAEAEDVAAAVLYLVSPAARMVSGLSLKLDGASTAQ